MSEVGKLLIETITDSDPAIRDRSVRELVATVERRRETRGLRGARTVSPRPAEPLRTGPRLALSPCALPLRDPGSTRRSRRGHIPFAGFMDLMERRYEQAIATFLEAMQARRAQRRDLQRAGAGLRADRLRDPGRPGAAVGSELSGQSLDVPGRRRRRASAAASSPASRARVGRGAVSRSWSSRRPCGWTCRTAAGPTSSSSAWIFPRARGCSISRSTLASTAAMPAPAADRDPAAGDHRADPAADQHRSERLQGRR